MTRERLGKHEKVLLRWGRAYLSAHELLQHLVLGLGLRTLANQTHKK